MVDHVSDEQLSLLLDAGLSLAAREAVIGHIRNCPSCAERHDRLIEVTATLRLAGTISWTPAQTKSTLTRFRPADRRQHVRLRQQLRGHDWSLPAAVVVAAAGVAALLLTPVGPGTAIAKTPANAGALLSLVLPVSGHVVAVLAAAVLIGCLAYPLSRSR